MCLINSIKEHEGFVAIVYKDSLGIDTIGYGFAIKDLELDPEAYYVGTPPLNNKAIEIWNHYKEISTLTPNNILKRHKM